jgi:hypothetical protein
MAPRRICSPAFAGPSQRIRRRPWERFQVPNTFSIRHPALAVLEVRVHPDLPPELLPDDYVLLRVDLPDEPPEEVAVMPPDPRVAGDAWLRSGRTAVLRAPSVIVPTATNLLLNPCHARAAEAQITLMQPFEFDPAFGKVGARLMLGFVRSEAGWSLLTGSQDG